MKMNNKVYDILKWIALVFLPGAGTFYFALSAVWGLPYVGQVAGTITAIDTFLGVLLGISSAGYYKDEVVNTINNINNNNEKGMIILDSENKFSE